MSEGRDFAASTYRERRLAKAERLRGWAETREVRAEAQLNSNPETRHDIAFITQPGHIPARARMIAADDRAFESLHKASEMRSPPTTSKRRCHARSTATTRTQSNSSKPALQG